MSDIDAVVDHQAALQRDVHRLQTGQAALCGAIVSLTVIVGYLMFRHSHPVRMAADGI